MCLPPREFNACILGTLSRLGISVVLHLMHPIHSTNVSRTDLKLLMHLLLDCFQIVTKMKCRR